MPMLETHKKQLGDAPPGTLVTVPAEKWIKLPEDPKYHQEGCYMNLRTGVVKHWSRIFDIEEPAYFEMEDRS